MAIFKFTISGNSFWFHEYQTEKIWNAISANLSISRNNLTLCKNTVKFLEESGFIDEHFDVNGVQHGRFRMQTKDGPVYFEGPLVIGL